MLRPALVALVLACLSGNLASAQDRLTLRLEAGPTYVHGASILGGTGRLGVDVAFGRMFAFEVSAGGGFAGRGDAGRGNLRAGVGFRLGARQGSTRPYFSLRAAHVHDAPLASFREHPGQAITGDPSHGLGHVTLAGAGAGCVLVPRGRGRLRATIEVESLFVAHAYERAHDPMGLAPRAYTTLALGVGWALR